jgi:uncharacterized ferritin-like protein (DUF455 family)
MTTPTHTIAETARSFLTSLYFRRLVSTRRGRSFVLHFLADAEDSDERGVFDSLLARVDDPELHKMVRIHRDDELRHAKMLRSAAERVGGEHFTVPDDLRIVPRITRYLGARAEGFADTPTDIMQTYALLLVIEERGVREFPRIVRALARVDAASAAVLAAIVKDEERHVKYARAISKRYAPDAETLDRTLAHFREVEARAFADNGRATLRFVVERGLFDAGPIEQRLWQAVS